MSAPAASPSAEDRLLTFELGGDLYAIPIAGVLEVANTARVTSIPTLPRSVGGVINHHGDALPIVYGSHLFDLDSSEPADVGAILVVSGRVGESARMGIPIDRVLGLVDGPAAATNSAREVAERRSIQGRVASVLDPQRLVTKARDVIESSLGRRD